MGEIRNFPTHAVRARPDQGYASTHADLPSLVGGHQMLYSVRRVALAQGMLMARFGMSEGYAMKYLSDQAQHHTITVVELAERVIQRVTDAESQATP